MPAVAAQAGGCPGKGQPLAAPQKRKPSARCVQALAQLGGVADMAERSAAATRASVERHAAALKGCGVDPEEAALSVPEASAKRRLPSGCVSGAGDDSSSRDTDGSGQGAHQPRAREPRDRSSSASGDYLDDDDDEVDEDYGCGQSRRMVFGRRQQGTPDQRLSQVRQSFVTRLKSHSKRTPQVGWLSGLHSSSEDE